ncbi:hypothetical protein N7495_005449, partial [Penicillium taxi]|uniref:uncharacterized protein n=1 Tax=Penicillium taxi TaxID=168475 RepID=UPI00254530F1
PVNQRKTKLLFSSFDSSSFVTFSAKMSEYSASLHGDPSSQHSQQLNRSCESCRSLKVRCLPNLATPNQCQRCAKGNKTCVFMAPQRRRPRKRTDSRVAQLEKEMRMMRSLLKDRIPEDSDPESPDESDNSQENKSGDVDFSADVSSGVSDSVHFMDYSSEISSTVGPLPLSFSGLHTNFMSDPNPLPANDIIDRGVISLNDAEQLVSCFIHEHSLFFPVVVLPPDTTATRLRQTKPVLFLSVVAAAAIAIDSGLAEVLNREIVRLYAQRFFVEGEKSLELVQALLLMCIFYFPPHSPLKLQFYQYAHIASTMALEIGLATKRRVPKRKSDHKGRHELYDEDMAEQARAVIGCYHLGSIVAMRTRRPNLLQFNDWMAECVTQLEQSPHLSDRHLGVWFQLQRITDETVSSFGLDDTSASSPLTESRVQAVLRWFDKRMETWTKSTPNDMLTVPIILQYRITNFSVYDLGIGEGYRDPDAIQKRYFTLPTPDEGKQEAPLSAIRVDINVKWMHAAQELLEAVLTCSVETMRKLPNLVYTRFVLAFTTLLKIHFSVRTGSLGQVVTLKAVNVKYYLDAISTQLSEASGGGKYKVPSRWFFIVAVKGRTWYERLEKRYTGVDSVAGKAPDGLSSGEAMVPVQMPGSQDMPSHMGPIGMPAVDSYSVLPAASHIPSGMEGRYMPMGANTGMWPVDGGHGQGQNHFYQSFPPGYPSQPQAVPLLPQYMYNPQISPPPGVGGQRPKTGMELDGWLPDGSVFSMPPLPEI